MKIVEAEIAKIAINSYVTTKISFSNQISEICEKPIYDKFYGFAFNGSVSGSVVWKVSERRVYISGTETMEDSESKEYEL
jgi:hypothetical protein